ncbi:MAG: HAMP domain-containing sensor histidine kinase [Candidatus Daviesbacteria bacterium]|nr:HAMP domain-containing sensor histidine kinase [Candidatus Daviesbacteria bacterium]
MEKGLYSQLYNYSKKYLSLQQKSLKLALTFGSNVLLAVVIFFFIDLSNTYPDKIPFYLVITAVIAISAFLGLIKDSKDVKELKAKQIEYAHSFTILHDEHALALKNIKARDQFLSIISHELKTPLTVMLLNLHSLSKSIQSDSLASFSIHELVKVLKNSEQQIKWLSSMVNDLLNVSLITTGRMDLKLENTDLVAITKQVIQSFSEMLKREKNKVKIQTKSAVVGKWDKLRLEQAITNLISNAIKYGNGKPIEIKISKSGNQGKFIIKDQGIGISSHDQRVIFDLFKRVSGPDEYKKGLGVGLFITSQIVKIHGGKIKVFSIPAKGATFTIELTLKK